MSDDSAGKKLTHTWILNIPGVRICMNCGFIRHKGDRKKPPECVAARAALVKAAAK